MKYKKETSRTYKSYYTKFDYKFQVFQSKFKFNPFILHSITNDRFIYISPKPKNITFNSINPSFIFQFPCSLNRTRCCHFMYFRTITFSKTFMSSKHSRQQNDNVHPTTVLHSATIAYQAGKAYWILFRNVQKRVYLHVIPILMCLFLAHLKRKQFQPYSMYIYTL